MMSKAELEALAEKYAAKAEKAFQNYQETGISRYSREYHNAEELFYAFQAAANAAEEHAALLGMQTVVLRKQIPKKRPGLCWKSWYRMQE